MKNLRLKIDQLKEKFEPINEKFQDIRSEPLVKDIIKTGNEALNIAAKIGQANLKGKVGTAAAIVGLADHIFNKADPSAYDMMLEYAKRFYLTAVKIRNYSFITLAHRSPEIPKKKIKSLTSGEEIYLIDIDSKKLLYVYSKYHGLEDGYGLFATDDKTVDYIISYMFNTFGSSIQMEIDNHKPRFIPIKRDINRIYLNDHDIDKFVNDFKTFQQNNITKSFVLVGPPGSGKSAFILKVSEALKTKLLLIDSGCLSGNYLSHVLQAIELFNPKVICFEDIERNFSINDSGVLTLIESIKANHPNTILFSTVNNPRKLSGALARPGRLGRRLEFNAPDKSTKLKLIKMYCELYKLRDISHLVDEMDHPAFTHDYIKDVCEHALIMDDKELKKFIASVIQYIKNDYKEH